MSIERVITLSMADCYRRSWWSSVPGRVDSTRSAKEKEETRLLARQLLVNAAPDGLRTALGYRGKMTA